MPVLEEAERLGITHNGGGRHTFHFDPIPRTFEWPEWSRLAAGLEQRLRALEAWVADAHGPRRAVREGVVPAASLESCVHAEPVAPAEVWIGVYGPDVVAGRDGELRVLEDNVRTPTMMAYAVWARRLLGGGLDDVLDVEAPLVAGMRRVLGDGRAVILGDGADSVVEWELGALADLLGVPLVETLRREGDRLVGPEGPVDVVWRRTSRERLSELPVLAGADVRVVNAFGTGVADDKGVFCHAEDLVRFFCGEEPLLRSVPAYDLGDDAHRRAALARLDELVFKPRDGSGGYGVVLAPRASRTALEELRAALHERPGAWIAQELVELSTEPTLVDGSPQPRHVDLRPFVLHDGSTLETLPGGLSRVSLAAGDLVVNCSQGGGGKDVRVRRPAATTGADAPGGPTG